MERNVHIERKLLNLGLPYASAFKKESNINCEMIFICR